MWVTYGSHPDCSMGQWVEWVNRCDPLSTLTCKEGLQHVPQLASYISKNQSTVQGAVCQDHWKAIQSVVTNNMIRPSVLLVTFSLQLYHGYRKYGCSLLIQNVAEMTGQHMVERYKCKKWYSHYSYHFVCEKVALNSMNSIANTELMVLQLASYPMQ